MTPTARAILDAYMLGLRCGVTELEKAKAE